MLSNALEGTLVLDLSQQLSGPFASRILYDLGARVIKIEPPGGRNLPVMSGGEYPGFLPPNVGKESLIVDLKNVAGRAVVRELAAKADVVLENFRPGVTGRIGVDYNTLRADNPDLIYCSISGFGSTGPLANTPAFDATIQAMSGIMNATGEADRPPALTSVNIGDLAASTLAANAITAAIVKRDRTGEGSLIDMSMLESTLYMLPIQTQLAIQADYIMSRHGSSYGPPSVAGAFLTSDAKYLQILCPHFHFQSRFRDAIAEISGFEDVSSDSRFADAESMIQNSEAFLAIAHQAFPSHDVAYWSARLDRADVPWGPILDFSTILTHRQVSARGAMGEVWSPGSDKAVPILRSPFHVAANEPPTVVRVPAYGQHGVAILGGDLGYSEKRIAQLAEQGAIILPTPHTSSLE